MQRVKELLEVFCCPLTCQNGILKLKFKGTITCISDQGTKPQQAPPKPCIPYRDMNDSLVKNWNMSPYVPPSESHPTPNPLDPGKNKTLHEVTRDYLSLVVSSNHQNSVGPYGLIPRNLLFKEYTKHLQVCPLPCSEITRAIAYPLNHTKPQILLWPQ